MEYSVGSLMAAMCSYFGRDVERINHALKVYGFAMSVGQLEGLSEKEQFILEAAAILHDIGIPESERKYNSVAGSYQEVEGPPIAAEILKGCGFDKALAERVCYLVGHHHTYDNIDGSDYQILVESDFLVNIFEGKMTSSAVHTVKEKVFKTAAGTKYVNSLYLE